MQPHLSRLLASDDEAGAKKIFQTSTVWLMACAWPAYLASAAAAPLLLGIFGHGYRGGQTPLVILSLTMLLATACGPVDIVLLIAGRSGLSLINNFASLAVDIALNIVLIPKYGITGAAISWAVGARGPQHPAARAGALDAAHESMERGRGMVAVTSVACFGILPAVVRAWVGLDLAVAVPCFAVCTVLYAGLLWVGGAASHSKPSPVLVAAVPMPPSPKKPHLLERGHEVERGTPTRARRVPTCRRTSPARGNGDGRAVSAGSTRAAAATVRSGRVSKAFLRRPRPVRVPIDSLLLGAQLGCPQNGSRMWSETRFGLDTRRRRPPRGSAQARDANGAALTDDEILSSAYGRMALDCIAARSSYFGCNRCHRCRRVSERLRRPLRGEAQLAARHRSTAAGAATRCSWRRFDGPSATRCSTPSPVGPGSSTRRNSFVEVTAKWLPTTTPLQESAEPDELARGQPRALPAG